MDEPITIPVEYRGVEMEFKARVQTWAYGYRLFVDVNGAEVVFERDNDENYRAILSPDQPGTRPDEGLIQAIVNSLQAL